MMASENLGKYLYIYISKWKVKVSKINYISYVKGENIYILLSKI